MLELVLPTEEAFDEESQSFVTVSSVRVELEHSLLSMSKWESFFEKPFLSTTDKTLEEILWYIEAMVISPDVPGNLFEMLRKEDIERINEYISSKQTATTFSDTNTPPNREIITSEIIYYWMISLGIPFECQYWHLNRLLALVRVCNLKNAPEKKMSKADIAKRNRELNAKRKAMYNTSG